MIYWLSLNYGVCFDLLKISKSLFVFDEFAPQSQYAPVQDQSVPIYIKDEGFSVTGSCLEDEGWKRWKKITVGFFLTEHVTEVT